jgi:hypothetical protein
MEALYHGEFATWRKQTRCPGLEEGTMVAKEAMTRLDTSAEHYALWRSAHVSRFYAPMFMAASPIV